MMALCGILLWLLGTLAHAQGLPAYSDRIQTAEDPGLFRVGDDLAWADPAFDDSDWEPAVLGRAWREWSTAGVDDSRGWYRVRIPVSPDYPVSLTNKNISAAAEIYVDGQLLHTFGDMDSGDFERFGRFTKVAIQVPRELTRDGEILVATRAVNNRVPLGRGFMAPWSHGHPEAVLQLPAQDLLRTRLVGILESFVGAGLTGLGGLHFLLWARRREPQQAFFALGATLLGLWLLSAGLIVWGEIPPYESLGRTWILRKNLAEVALLWFVYHFVGSKAYRTICVVSALVLVPALLRIFLHEMLYDYAFLLAQVPVAVLALTQVVLIIGGLRRGVPYVWFLAAGFIPLNAFWVLDTIVFGVWPAYGSSLSIFRFLVMHFGWASILVIMSFVLTSHFADTLDELERVWRATARFVPDQFLALLGRRRITEVERGDSTTRDITVMFCAIPGFSDTTQSWTSEQSFAFLNRFLQAMEPCIHDNGGFVAQYLGDGFLAMFPVGSSRPVHAAIALQEAARALEPEPGEPGVKVALGLHTGPVMLGTVGSEERLTTGQVSDVVNTSSRVKGLTAHYGAPIVISEATRALIEDEGWALQELDAVIMKGKVEALRAFEVLSGEPDLILRRYKESGAAVYGEGLAAFRAGELERARPLFALLAEKWVAARLFVQRCDWFLTHGLPDDWDGVIRMTVK